MLVQISWECTPLYLSTGISNLLQPAQAEVVLGQLSTYLASWFLSANTVGWPTEHYLFSKISQGGQGQHPMYFRLFRYASGAVTMLHCTVLPCIQYCTFLHMLCKLNINARVHTVAWLIFNLERIVTSVHI